MSAAIAIKAAMKVTLLSSLSPVDDNIVATCVHFLRWENIQISKETLIDSLALRTSSSCILLKNVT